MTGFMVEVEGEVGETGGAALAVSRSAEEAAGAGACAKTGAEAGIEDAGAEAGMGVDADGEMEPGDTAVPGGTARPRPRPVAAAVPVPVLPLPAPA